MKRRTLLCFLLLVFTHLSLAAAIFPNGFVNVIWPKENKIFFKLSSDSTSCLGSNQYYTIKIDENDALKKVHTVTAYYYPLILLSLEDYIKLYMRIEDGDAANCGSTTINEIPVNYMYMNF